MADNAPVSGSGQKIAMTVDGESWGPVISFEMRRNVDYGVLTTNPNAVGGASEYDVSIYANQVAIDSLAMIATKTHRFEITVSDAAMAFDGVFSAVDFAASMDTAVRLDATIVATGPVVAGAKLPAGDDGEPDDLPAPMEWDGVFWLTMIAMLVIGIGLAKMLKWF